MQSSHTLWDLSVLSHKKEQDSRYLSNLTSNCDKKGIENHSSIFQRIQEIRKERLFVTEEIYNTSQNLREKDLSEQNGPKKQEEKKQQ